MKLLCLVCAFCLLLSLPIAAASDAVSAATAAAPEETDELFPSWVWGAPLVAVGLLGFFLLCCKI